MDTKKIVGIMLVKNEEYFAALALQSILDFCDEIIILDNMSEDTTYEQIQELSANYSKIRLQRIVDFRKSHQPLERYVGTNTWVFGVDGDEIYDASGLGRLRARIFHGEFDKYWKLSGHMIHVDWYDFQEKRVKGYRTPAARGGTKLFNFGALDSWIDGKCERLHGGNPIFKTGYSADLVLRLEQQQSWGNCDLRCLHMCFVPRSSLDPKLVAKRNNPSWERKKYYVSHFFKKRLRAFFDSNHYYKNRRYRQGPRHAPDISMFKFE